MKELSRIALAIAINYKLRRYIAILLISNKIKIIQQYEQFIVIIFRKARSIRIRAHSLYISYVYRIAMPGPSACRQIIFEETI